MRKTTLLTCGAAAIAALVLSGCQSGGESGSGNSGNGAGSSAEIGSLSMLADVVSKKSTEKQSAHMQMSIEGGEEAINAQGDIQFGNDVAMEMTMAVPEMAEVTMRLVDNVFYIKTGEELEPGKPWLKIDANGSDPMSKVFASLVDQMKSQGDPSQTLKQLQDAGEITSKKSEQLDGQDTTHYTVTVDVQKALAKADPELKKMLDGAATAGLKDYPMDIWLNKDNLPVRIVTTVSATNPQTQKTEQAKVTVNYTDWGKKIEVAAPAPNEIAEFPS
ncbi:hypothetical protein [Actinophytocola sp.]|uniref:hypothetical protein n=1 Tax=Actinophytocola sp. TaxID=1872138 RepID=UPI002D807E05|nr:hypothetical protein [Actinophytocola sp.]HET9139574.1 hypothetical protein [Actinophytocola sp.]